MAILEQVVRVIQVSSVRRVRWSSRGHVWVSYQQADGTLLNGYFPGLLLAARPRFAWQRDRAALQDSLQLPSKLTHGHLVDSWRLYFTPEVSQV